MREQAESKGQLVLDTEVARKSMKLLPPGHFPEGRVAWKLEGLAGGGVRWMPYECLSWQFRPSTR